MKKGLVLGGFLLVLGTEAGAQQLSNSDFEQGWEDCYPLTSYETLSETKVGSQPIGWHSANVYQSGVPGELVTKVEENGNTYVRMENKFIGIDLGAWLGKIGSNAPGYLTLGKPWACANMSGLSIKDADGGTYGGVEFAYRPDAISFKYKRSHGSEKADEPFTVSAYSWNGTFTSDEKVGVPTKDCVMDDRERVVLGTNPDAISSGKLIASVTEKIDGDASGWTEKIVRLNYNTEYSEEIPTKFNIIFSSADYYGDRNEIGAGNVLCIDDVKLIYNSELASLTYDGKPITVQENMDLSDQMYDENKLSCTLTGKGATVDKSFNKVTGVLTLIVKGNDWTEENPSNQHIYTVQFAKPIPSSAEVAGDYTPLLKISLAGSETFVPSVNDINIQYSEENGTVFTMKDFNFAGVMDLGDVVVPGATLSYVNGGIKVSVEDKKVTLPAVGEVGITVNAIVDDNKELTGTVDITYPLFPISVSLVKCPFERELTNYTLTVKGDVTSDVAAAVVPLGKTVGLVDLTQAKLGDGLNTSNFLYNPEATNNVLYKISDTQSLEGKNVIKNGICDNFVLTDGQSFNAPTSFTANQITYKRAVAASTDEKDEVYTFVLPFTFTADKVNGTVYELSGVNNGVLDFTSLKGSMELKANRPYLVVSNGNGTQLLNASAFSGEVVATGDLTNEVYGGVTMVGAYEATPITSGASESWYGYNANGQFVKANTGTINPFRTAIKSTGSQSSFALKLDGTVTGIVNLENPNAKVDVYTVSGVCVRKNVPAASALNGLSRGVYIVGGQKVVK